MATLAPLQLHLVPPDQPPPAVRIEEEWVEQQWVIDDDGAEEANGLRLATGAPSRSGVAGDDVERFQPLIDNPPIMFYSREGEWRPAAEFVGQHIDELMGAPSKIHGYEVEPEGWIEAIQDWFDIRGGMRTLFGGEIARLLGLWEWAFEIAMEETTVGDATLQSLGPMNYLGQAATATAGANWIRRKMSGRMPWKQCVAMARFQESRLIRHLSPRWEDGSWFGRDIPLYMLCRTWQALQMTVPILPGMADPLRNEWTMRMVEIKPQVIRPMQRIVYARWKGSAGHGSYIRWALTPYAYSKHYSALRRELERVQRAIALAMWHHLWTVEDGLKYTHPGSQHIGLERQNPNIGWWHVQRGARRTTRKMEAAKMRVAQKYDLTLPEE